MNFKKKSLTTSCGKFIDVYDNVFSIREQECFEMYFINSNYTYQNTKTSATTTHLPSTFLHCRLDNSKDVQSLGFFNNNNIKLILSQFNRLEFNVAWINLSLPGTYYQKHTDIGDVLNEKALTLMYYGTTTWQDSYGGETFFYNDYGEKEIVVDYIPGRVVIFDSSTCHKPAFSYGHVVGRYTFVTLFFCR
jgi:Rps23 Pro-64 3,4-dihydroxylase Tpa1-like proline 4-hydroxylase